ncbi:MAG: fused MFS/spermidine synthase, partial [Alphaproteobacteria bacterium]|nr:fused MFS/spermidine synthase [Alphaproteobacteria bacterium]
FQACLLIGYAYAHLLARTLAVSRAALVHLAVLAAAALTLPIGIAESFGDPPSTGIGLWLVALFAASIGLPFIALSASAPLLQSWFATTAHPQARNPYVLYAASNLGSFAALLAYPLVVESWLPLRTQSWAWSVGFAVLAVLIAIAGVVAARSHALVTVAQAGAPPTTQDRVGWLIRAAIPAGLTIAVTAHISTDIAAAPLLWVLPLALYLLTFVAVFRDRPWFSHDIVIKVVPFLVAPLAISLLGDGARAYWFASIIINLGALFVLSLACHGELYRHRPAPARLTEFYLWTSLGGVVGRIFAGLLAPYLFNRTYEYPILVVAALLALPGALSGGVRSFVVRVTPALASVLVVIVLRLVVDVRIDERFATSFQVMLVMLAGFMLLRRRDTALFAALAVMAFVITGVWQPGMNVVKTARSFFGVHRVLETSGGTHRIMYHGTTIHGAERVRETDHTPVLGRPEPLTYYYFGGPISEAVAAARQAQGGLKNVAVVGLGSGSLACHAKEGESWTFFEIDPEVVRLARDPNIFRFISECAPTAAVVLGDARLTLKNAQAQYDLIVLDAFSSDAIPVHLLTREALRGYLARLSPHGVIVMHISNRHMELLNVVAAIGAAEGLVTYARQDQTADVMEKLQANALVAALARRAADLAPLTQKGWREAEPSPSVAPWADDYSDVIGAIWRKKF